MQTTTVVVNSKRNNYTFFLKKYKSKKHEAQNIEILRNI